MGDKEGGFFMVGVEDDSIDTSHGAANHSPFNLFPKGVVKLEVVVLHHNVNEGNYESRREVGWEILLVSLEPEMDSVYSCFCGDTWVVGRGIAGRNCGRRGKWGLLK